MLSSATFENAFLVIAFTPNINCYGLLFAGKFKKISLVIVRYKNIYSSIQS